MYKETSSIIHGNDTIFVSIERTDIIQISKSTFCYNRCSIFIDDSKKSMSRFRIQLILEDNTWSTRYNTPRSDRYSISSNQRTILSLNFTVEKHGFKLNHDQIDRTHADISFSNIIITHSV